MNLILSRAQSRAEGIFGEILDEGDKFIFVTLEHAYPMDTGFSGARFSPKVPVGTYTCRRGKHRLASMKEDFETFEVLEVPGHTGVLFHCGNTNQDSQGCILLGTVMVRDTILNSRVAFSKFMELQLGVDEFMLLIK